MKVMTKQKQKQPPIVPKKYAGQWIAWDHDQTRIIASGRTFAEVLDAARAAGEPDPLLEKVPRSDVRFVGGP